MTKTPDNVVGINTSLNEFFRYWFEFLKPFHHLTEREIDVITSFVRQRYELSKVIRDDNILDRVVMGEDTKAKVREECNMTLPHFQVVMGKLKSRKIIIDGKINRRFIPNLKEGAKDFKLMFYFDIKNAEKV